MVGISHTSKERGDWAELTLTHRCNQRCFFCYEEGREIAREPHLDEVRRLLAETRKRASRVVLCGKEFLLRPDWMQIVAHARSLGLVVSVFTNGQALARPGVVERLVEAGCNSVAVSFHFPDAETFARGARVQAERFDLTVEGLTRVRDHNREQPERPLSISVEIDMFVLNAGRLAEMRRILTNALGDTGWSLRLASLLPVRCYDIGLPHALDPLEERRAELAAFVKSQPHGLPLHFVKVPVCLLPPGCEHLSLEVEYISKGTVLTYNHEETDRISLDVHTTSATFDSLTAMRSSPYRWVCRTCGLAAICRFLRLDWFLPQFLPSKEQKPRPFTATSAVEVVSRIDPGEDALRRVEAVSLALQSASPFPEEILLEALRGGTVESDLEVPSPRLVDAWVEGEPILAVELSHGEHRLTLQLGAPTGGDGERSLGALIGYLEVRAIDTGRAPPEVVDACLDMIADLDLPELGLWAEDQWFDLRTAKLFRCAWGLLGRRLWPGRGTWEGGWHTRSVTLVRNSRLHLELERAEGGQLRLVLQPSEAADGTVSQQVSKQLPRGDGSSPPTPPAAHPYLGVSVLRGGGLQRRNLDGLIGFLGRRAGVTTPPPGTLLWDRVLQGELEVHARNGEWQTRHVRRVDDADGSAAIGFVVRERASPREPAYHFHVTEHVPTRPCYQRVGDLALWYEHDEMTRGAAIFAKVLTAAMKHLQHLPLNAEAVPVWSRVVLSMLRHTGQADRYTWSIQSDEEGTRVVQEPRGTDGKSSGA